MSTDEVWDGRGLSYVPGDELDIAPELALHVDVGPKLDPVTYQVIRWKLWNINLQHSDVIKRVSGSPVIVYMDDFNTSLLTETGDTVVCGPTIQYFTGMGDLIVKWTLEHRSRNPGIEEGDVFLQNDPYIGAAHQIDTAVYAPVFVDGGLFCWVLSAAHQGDLGGSTPGGFAVTARDIFDESLPVPPIKLARRGAMLDDVVEMFIRRSRTPDMVALQLRSQVAGLSRSTALVQQLVADYGAPTVKAVMQRMIDDCSRAVSERLEAIPDGVWAQQVYYGGAFPGDRKGHRVGLAIEKRGEVLTCSNAGTDEQVSAGNCTFSAWRSGIVCAASTLFAHDQMCCPAGVVRHLRFDPVPGTITCARYPAAVSTVTATIINLYLSYETLGAVALAGPSEVAEAANASGCGGRPGMFAVTGHDRQGRYVTNVTGDSIAGGMGAFSGRDGIDSGGGWFMPGNVAGECEEWESALPILYIFRRHETDSGGPGTFRGGNGISIAVVGHGTSDATAQVIACDPAVNPIAGMAGGYRGHPGDYWHAGGTDIRAALVQTGMPRSSHDLRRRYGGGRLDPKSSVPLGENDVLLASYSAGGGFGDPLSRDPGAVVADVVGGAVSGGLATEHYGVVVQADGSLDDAATERRRSELRRRRLGDAADPPRSLPDERLGDAVARLSLGPSLACAEHRGDIVWVCGCGAVLGSIDDDYKIGLPRADRLPVDFNLGYPDHRDFCDDPFVIRSYFCPRCGEQLGSEFVRSDEEPWRDCRLDRSSVARLLAQAACR